MSLHRDVVREILHGDQNLHYFGEALHDMVLNDELLQLMKKVFGYY